MILSYWTLVVALSLSIIAAWYSIAGLTAIFAAAATPIIIMGGIMEIAKVTVTVWLHEYWPYCKRSMKAQLSASVVLLMFITSMGIFGFLSKAHSDQSLVSGDSMAKVAIYDEKINTAKENIATNRKALKQMDEAVDQVMGRSDDEKGADKAVAIRRSQSKERARLLAEIETEQRKVAALSEERAPFAAEFRKVESEVGPIKYIAALIYGDNPDANILERAVRWVIILIVAVFDPLALVLILAAQQTLRWAQEDKENKPAVEQVVEEEQEILDEVESESKPRFFGWPLPGNLNFPFPKREEVKEEPPSETVYVNPPDWGTTPISDESLAVYDDERMVSNLDKQILAAGVDDVERPGDYLTPQDDEASKKKSYMTKDQTGHQQIKNRS